MSRLSDLPNISTKLEEQLIQVGIPDQETLFELGTIKTYEKIMSIRTRPCPNTLYALEGAIQGVRWHNLSQEVKDGLKQSI
jgi:DNA transformation protein